jgi:hypothetical protein
MRYCSEAIISGWVEQKKGGFAAHTPHTLTLTLKLDLAILQSKILRETQHIPYFNALLHK